MGREEGIEVGSWALRLAARGLGYVATRLGLGLTARASFGGWARAWLTRGRGDQGMGVGWAWGGRGAWCGVWGPRSSTRLLAPRRGALAPRRLAPSGPATVSPPSAVAIARAAAAAAAALLGR